jgi:hypothetical protein
MSNEKRDRDTDARRREHIAVAAYYKAEKRNFEADMNEDWLEAERQYDERDGRPAAEHSIEPEAVARWAHKLGVDPRALRTAIARVGPKVRDVEAFLKDHRQAKGPATWKLLSAGAIMGVVVWQLVKRTRWPARRQLA